MQINPISFTGNVTVLNGAKKYSNKEEIKQIEKISDFEDVDFYIYSSKKSGKYKEYCAITPIGDSAHLRKFNFRSGILTQSEKNDIKPSFSIQQAVCVGGKPYTLNIQCDKEHGELLIGKRDSTSCILMSKHDLNFRLGGYLGEKFTGTLFNKNKDGNLNEFNFEDGKLTAKKTFNKEGELILESEFTYDTEGSMTASLNKRLEDNNFNVFLPYNQSEMMFSFLAQQLSKE